MINSYIKIFLSRPIWTYIYCHTVNTYQNTNCFCSCCKKRIGVTMKAALICKYWVQKWKHKRHPGKFTFESQKTALVFFSLKNFLYIGCFKAISLKNNLNEKQYKHDKDIWKIKGVKCAKYLYSICVYEDIKLFKDVLHSLLLV